MNLIDVVQKFKSDEDCLAYLEAMRWPTGVRCPVCGNNEKISRVTRKSKSKNKRAQLYTCLETTCKEQFSVTTGSIFHGTHLPLVKWFMALALIVDAKKGISARQLGQHLGMKNYRVAWHMYHRIRKAMEDGDLKLHGDIEIDETYCKGKSKDIHGRVRSKRKSDTVIGLRERGAKGRVKFVHVPDAKALTVKAVIDAHIHPHITKTIYTDQASIYPFALDKHFRHKHKTINHSRTYVDGDIHTNTIESAFSLLKRGIIGSYHWVSIKHLHRYLSEFENRFNGRNDRDLFSSTLRRMMNTIPLQYKELTASASS